MTVSTQERPAQAATDLKEIAADVVRRAMQGGATAAEAVAMDGSEFSTVVRLGEVETLKESGSKGNRRTRFLWTARCQYLLQRPDAGGGEADGRLRAGAGQDHQRRSFRRYSRAIRNWASWKAISTCTTTTSTRCRPRSASITLAAPRKLHSTSIPASPTPKAAPSTRPSGTRCWPTRTVLSATTSGLTARFQPFPSRRSVTRPCSATTGTPWR